MKQFKGIVTRPAEEDMPLGAFRDILNAHIEEGELVVRLGGAKQNTTRLGSGPGLGIAQFTPRREFT
jgi:hypothetical protein